MREKVMKNKKICVAANCVRHKKNQGITLVALVITIVIMLILSTITIGAINGGLFDYAGKAKKDTEEVSKVTGIQESFILAKGTSKTGRISATDMQNALDKIFEKDYAEAIDNEGGITIKIENKYYDIDSNGNPGEGKTMEKIDNPGDITKGGRYNGNTKETAFRIECIEDLVAFSKNVNTGNTYAGKFIVLAKDLDFNSIFSYSNYKAKYSYNEEQKGYIPDETSETTIKELCTIGEGFIQIKQFNGSFNGQNCHINNIHINRTGSVAFFMASRGSIKNLTIDGHIVSTDGSAVGLVFSTYYATIENCVNKAKVEGKTNASGIVDNFPNSSIILCGNEGEILASTGRATGVANTFSSKINKCYNTGFVSGSEAYGISGLDLWGQRTLTNCYNTGRIIGTSGSAAGVKYSNTSKALNCFNSGSITAGTVGWNGGGTRGVGGISGGNYSNGTYINCCSIGLLEKLSGTDLSSSGLIAGSTTNNTNCYYLDGIQGTTGLNQKTGETVFYKTSDNEEDMTTAKVVEKLNEYIRLKGVLEEGDTEVDTTGWCRWKVGENNLPELELEWEWEPTAGEDGKGAFVKVNN